MPIANNRNPATHSRKIAGVPTTNASHGGNMIIDGDDLHILMRTADAAAKNAHNSNLITFHTVRRFRDLVY